jgi:Flp pilus assembly pilin Flp
MPPIRHLHLSHQSGQTLSEYSLLIGLIALAVAVLLPGIASGLIGFISDAATALGG